MKLSINGNPQSIYNKVAWLLFWGTAFRFFLVLLAIFCLPLDQTLAMVHDDAYYYLDMARSLGQGHGAIYGGLLLTNGYQPLWQGVLTVVSWLLGNDREGLFRATLLLPLPLLLLGLLWLWHSSRHVGDDLAMPLVVGVLAVFITFQFSLGMGMETSLMLWLLPYLAYVLERRVLTNGALLAFSLLPLIRLDALIVPVIHGVLLLWLARRHQQPVIWRHFAIFLLPLLVVVMYAIANQQYFGWPLPISGVVKSAGGAWFTNLPALWQGVTTPVLTGTLLLWLLMECLTRGLPKDARFFYVMTVLLLATLGQSIYYGFFSTWPLWPWYTYLAACFSAVAIARMAYLVPVALSAKRWLPLSIGLGVLIFILAQVPRTAATTNLLAWMRHQLFGVDVSQVFQVRLAHTATQIRTDVYPLLEGKTVAMGDRAGVMVYWRPEQARFIQTEGLMADMAYHQSRFAGRGEAYLVNHGVDLLITDRDYYAQEPMASGKVFVIPEPAMGAMTKRGAMLFCFPQDAVLREYSDVKGEIHTRLFDFHRRVPCSPDITQRYGEIERGELGYTKYIQPHLADGSWLDRLGRYGRTLQP